MPDFAPGDLVKLKSGGPGMTVEKLGKDFVGNERVWCIWFDNKGTEQKGNYPPESLEKYDPTPDMPMVSNPPHRR